MTSECFSERNNNMTYLDSKGIECDYCVMSVSWQGKDGEIF